MYNFKNVAVKFGSIQPYCFITNVEASSAEVEYLSEIVAPSNDSAKYWIRSLAPERFHYKNV